jgi:copper homeostasis protein
VTDLEGAVERVVECGFASVLTSGGTKSAGEGVERVRVLQERFGARVSLVMGGGVRSGNVWGLKRRAGVEWVHSAAITGEGEEVDGEEVRRIVEVLEKGENGAGGD